MASEVSICNRALRKINAKTILTLIGSTKEAKECNRFYAVLRDELLEEHPWKFASTRITLAPSATTPVYDWSFSSPLPADFIRLVEVEDAQEHALEDGAILSNNDTLSIRYVYRITNVNQFSSLFASTLVARLAEELSIPIADDKKLKKDMHDEYLRLSSRAKNSSATQSTPPVVEADAWINARR